MKSIKGYLTKILSILYFLILLYNLYSAKFVPAFIALLLFVFSCPLFFRKTKERYNTFFKKLNLVSIIPLLIMIVSSVIIGSTGAKTDIIPEEEQHYINTTLSKITTETTKEEAIILLGKPDRDLVSKVNWWVNINDNNSRVGIYFSLSTGKAYEIVLDGGMGKFYYRKKLE